MNATLQCLTYTPPLARFLLDGSSEAYHPQCAGQPHPSCMLCTLRSLVRSALSARPHAVLRPAAVAATLSRVCRTFRRGVQEDAHECLRGLLEGLQRACLGQSIALRMPPERVAPEREAATAVHAIFGGRICGCVRCLSCGFESRTTDPFLDLSVDVGGGGSVEDGLARFLRPERLEGTGYRCDGCKRRVAVEKATEIAQAPLVLTLHLKRFAFMRHMRHVSKISRPVSYPLRIHNFAGTGCSYDLFGVLVHVGSTVHSGHYYAFVKAPAGQWYEMDDESVRQVPVATALKQSAYILFYIRTSIQVPSLFPPAAVQQPPPQPAPAAAASTAHVFPKKRPQKPEDSESEESEDDGEWHPKATRRHDIVWTETPLAPPPPQAKPKRTSVWQRTSEAEAAAASAAATAAAKLKGWHAPMALPEALEAAEVVPMWDGTPQTRTPERPLSKAERKAASRSAKDAEWDAEYDAPRPVKKRSREEMEERRKRADRSAEFDRFLETRTKKQAPQFHHHQKQQQRRK